MSTQDDTSISEEDTFPFGNSIGFYSCKILSELSAIYNKYLLGHLADLEEVFNCFSGIQGELKSSSEILVPEQLQSLKDLLADLIVPLKSLRQNYDAEACSINLAEKNPSEGRIDCKRREYELQAVLRLFQHSCSTQDPIESAVLAELTTLLETVSVLCQTHEINGFQLTLNHLLNYFEPFLPLTIAQLYCHFEFPYPPSLQQRLPAYYLQPGKASPQRRSQRKKKKTPAKVSSPSSVLAEIPVNTTTANTDRRKRGKCDIHSDKPSSVETRLFYEDSIMDENKLFKTSQDKSSTGGSSSTRKTAQNVLRSIRSNQEQPESLNFQSEAMLLGYNMNSNLSVADTCSSSGLGPGSSSNSCSGSKRTRTMTALSENNENSNPSAILANEVVSRSASSDSRYFTIGGCTIIQKQKQPTSQPINSQASNSQGDSVFSLTPPPTLSVTPNSPLRRQLSKQPSMTIFSTLEPSSSSNSCSQPSTPPKSQRSHLESRSGIPTTPTNSTRSRLAQLSHGLSPVPASPHLLHSHMSPGLRSLFAESESTRQLMVKETPPRGKRLKRPSQPTMSHIPHFSQALQLLSSTSATRSTAGNIALLQHWSSVSTSPEDSGQGDQFSSSEEGVELPGSVLVF